MARKMYGTEVVNVQIDKEKLAEIDKLLECTGKGSRSALKLALNKTTSGVVTDTKKAIYQVLNLTQSRIAKDLKTTTATEKDLSASVFSHGKQIELMEFGAKVVKAGVQYKIERNGEKATVPEMFIQRGGGGDLHVMKRTSARVGTGKPIGVPKAGYYYTFPQWWSAEMRYPAHIKYGPSIPQVWGKPVVLDETLKKANERLDTELDRATKKLLADAEKGSVIADY